MRITTKFLIFLISAASLLAANQTSWGASYITIRSRCTENNLDPGPAHGRNAWAKKCFSSAIEQITFHDQQTPVEYALVSDKNESKWNAPTDAKDACGEFETIHAFCVASCYTPSQRIRFDGVDIPVKTALLTRERNVTTLSKSASLENLTYDILPVESYTQSWRDGYERILVLEMRSGGNLEVTLGHPILLSSGIMVKAKDLSVGDRLIRSTGEFDPIDKIRELGYFGKVYNLAPDSLDPVENILVAEGYLAGSANYQYHQLFQSMWYRQMLRSMRDVSQVQENGDAK
ncbi:MAG: hypothetical protein HYW48_08365 [Deltaproteobacteria bacterium]|nr:hypothetical protein [Deltaproteobacteria bacterium]